MDTKLHEGAGLRVQAGNVAIDDSAPHHPECGFWADKIVVVQVVDHFHDVLSRQARILDVGHLVPCIIRHGIVGDEAILLCVIEKFSARNGVRDRNPDGLAVESFCEPARVVDRLYGLAGQPEDEVAMKDQTEFVAVAGKVECALNGRAFLDVLEDLLVVLRATPGRGD